MNEIDNFHCRLVKIENSIVSIGCWKLMSNFGKVIVLNLENQLNYDFKWLFEPTFTEICHFLNSTYKFTNLYIHINP